MAKDSVRTLRRLLKYYAYLLVVWGFFRYLFKFPDDVEELWFKPLFWLLPLLSIWAAEKKRLNFFAGKLGPALRWGLGVGLAYWLILALIQWVRGGFTGLVVDFSDPAAINFAGISLATAITEELVFSGYFYQKLAKLTRSEWNPIIWTCLLFAVIHIPIGLFLYRYSAYQLSFFLILVFTVQLGNTYVMSRSKNILGPILSHWFWGLAAFLLY